jgi:hypothetical protein
MGGRSVAKQGKYAPTAPWRNLAIGIAFSAVGPERAGA